MAFDDDKSFRKEESKLTSKLMFSRKFRGMEKKEKEKKEYRDVLTLFSLDV